MIRRVLILTFTACFLTSCAPAPNNPTTANVNTAPPSAPAAPSPAAESRESSAQITLPLLNALLGDENFVNDLRSRLKLTNEQIDSLKRVSNEEIARLQEANAEEVDASSGNAREHASEQLNQILGA